MRISDWSSDVCSSDLPARETHRLEAFAHRTRQGQLLGLLAQRVAASLVGGAAFLFFQPLRQAVADQQAGLRAVAGEVESGAGAGLGQRGEVDRGGDEIGSASGRGRVCQYV